MLSVFGAMQVLRNYFLEIRHPPPRNSNNVEPCIFVALVSRKPDNLPPPTALRNTWMPPLIVFLIVIWYSKVAQYLFGQLFDVWNVIKKIFKHSFSILIKKFYSVTVLRWLTNAAHSALLSLLQCKSTTNTAVQVYHQYCSASLPPRSPL